MVLILKKERYGYGKPGMIYLDVINKIKNNFKVPVLVIKYLVRMIKNGIEKKILKKDSIIESIMSFKRAGACAIVTYFAIDVAKIIKSTN